MSNRESAFCTGSSVVAGLGADARTWVVWVTVKGRGRETLGRGQVSGEEASGSEEDLLGNEDWLAEEGTEEGPGSRARQAQVWKDRCSGVGSKTAQEV